MCRALGIPIPSFWRWCSFVVSALIFFGRPSQQAGSWVCHKLHGIAQSLWRFMEVPSRGQKKINPQLLLTSPPLNLSRL
ncbi:hypothetical protein F4814DRAFT_435824, partial [Daldinia grandis]